MLDRFVLTYTRPAQTWLAHRAIQSGFTADRLTLIGFVIGLCVIPLLAFQLPLWALLAILINRIIDGLDGTVARLSTPTDRGGFLDIVLDFLFYSAVPLGFALYSPPENALAAATLIYAFIGTGCSFLAFAIIVEKRGLASTAYPQKSFYYLGGLTEASETILVFALMCLFPRWFSPLAYLFSALCLFTTLTRIYAGWHVFASESTASK
ncbi:MAG: CDP-alcohol phosphatidyltransferase family protein [Plesiomonas sp.]